jgi:hypothetical protein
LQESARRRLLVPAVCYLEAERNSNPADKDGAFPYEDENLRLRASWKSAELLRWSAIRWKHHPECSLVYPVLLSGFALRTIGPVAPDLKQPEQATARVKPDRKFSKKSATERTLEKEARTRIGQQLSRPLDKDIVASSFPSTELTGCLPPGHAVENGGCRAS